MKKEPRTMPNGGHQQCLTSGMIHKTSEQVRFFFYFRHFVCLFALEMSTLMNNGRPCKVGEPQFSGPTADTTPNF